MTDYTNYAISEAAERELARLFIDAIKLLDSEVAANRLVALYNSNGPQVKFTDLMGQFNSLLLVKTSADK